MEFAKILLSSVLSYAALFLSAKVIGRKQISQLDSFDYVSGIAIGSIAAELATDLENMWKPLLAIAVYMLFTWGMSIVSLRSNRARKYLNGTPSILMKDGKLYRENMKKSQAGAERFSGDVPGAGLFQSGRYPHGGV